MIETPTMVEVPLWRDENGKLRVANTRVLLELVIYAFHQGETAEGIVDSYPTLKLADVYGVISYYLNHRGEIDEYIRLVDERGARLQQEIEASYTPETHALLKRLRALRDEKRHP
jgi:uncharacterized protein (DUF433 family)